MGIPCSKGSTAVGTKRDRPQERKSFSPCVASTAVAATLELEAEARLGAADANAMDEGERQRARTATCHRPNACAVRRKRRPEPHEWVSVLTPKIGPHDEAQCGRHRFSIAPLNLSTPELFGVDCRADHPAERGHVTAGSKDPAAFSWAGDVVSAAATPAHSDYCGRSYVFPANTSFDLTGALPHVCAFSEISSRKSSMSRGAERSVVIVPNQTVGGVRYACANTTCLSEKRERSPRCRSPSVSFTPASKSNPLSDA